MHSTYISWKPEGGEWVILYTSVSYHILCPQGKFITEFCFPPQKRVLLIIRAKESGLGITALNYIQNTRWTSHMGSVILTS